MQKGGHWSPPVVPALFGAGRQAGQTPTLRVRPERLGVRPGAGRRSVDACQPGSPCPRSAPSSVILGAPTCSALLDGRALTATELAWSAGRRPRHGERASGQAGDRRPARGGAAGAAPLLPPGLVEIARMLESMMVVANGAAEPAGSRRRATPRIDPALRNARTCYDHLAGRLGVGIADALVAKGADRARGRGGRTHREWPELARRVRDLDRGGGPDAAAVLPAVPRLE